MRLYKKILLVILILTLSLLTIFLWLFYNNLGRPSYPPLDRRDEHTEYIPLLLPSDLTKLNPNYLGYHLDNYTKLKNCKVSEQDGQIAEKELDSLFKETIFNFFYFYTDNKKYLNSISYNIKLKYNDSIQVKKKIKQIFRNLILTYGNNYKIYEYLYSPENLSKESNDLYETRFCIHWAVNNNSIYFNFNIIDRSNSLTNKIIEKYRNSYLEKYNYFGVDFRLNDEGCFVDRDKWFFQNKSWQESKKSEYIIKFINSIQD